MKERIRKEGISKKRNRGQGRWKSKRGKGGGREKCVVKKSGGRGTVNKMR